METRIERIERYIEEFAKGMLELKESQKKADARQSRMDAQILELKEAQKKTDANLNRTDEQLKKTIKKLDDIGVNLGKMGLAERLKSKPIELKPFKKAKVESIMADFVATDLYEEDFLKDFEVGLKKSSLNM